MSDNRGKRKRVGPVRNLLSLALFGIAAVLFVIVAVMYFRDDDKGNGIAPTPASLPGEAQIKNVYDALAAQGLKVAYAKGIGPRFGAFSQPGQGLTVDGQPIYIFIYESSAAREEETGELTADDLIPTPPASAKGTPVAGGTPHGVGHSNVYAILLGGSDDVIAKVDRAMQGIP